jgi:hypothetical protein
MRAERVKIPESSEAVSSHRVKQRVKRRKSQRSAPVPRKNRGWCEKKWEKGLANL